MLRRNFFSYNGFIVFLITLISVGIILSMLLLIIDYSIFALTDEKLQYALQNPFRVFFGYLLGFCAAFFYFFIFVYVFANEFIYRYFRIHFALYFVVYLTIFSFISYYSYKDTYKLIPHHGNVEQYKYSVCLILVGIIYPFISNFWAKKFLLDKIIL